MPDLASSLQALKERSGLSYAELAERCRLSPSTLHRYCRGQTVPGSFGMVERIAVACGADRDEMDGLYHVWAQADAARMSASPSHTPEPAAPPSTTQAPSPTTVRRGHRPLWPAALMGLFLLVAATAAASAPLWAPSQARSTAGRPQAQQVSGPSWTQYPSAVPSAFYGVTMNSDSGAMPTFQVGGIRLWDSETRWAQVEPERGRYDWRVLNRLVAAAGRRRLPVLYTFGGTPSWAAPSAPRGPYPDGSRVTPPDNLDDWVNFVQAVATRYAGRISAYELWALAPSPHFFTGDPATLARMTERASAVIRRADPKATVVCPSIGDLWEQASQRFLRGFAAAGGYQDCDVAGVKLYPRQDGDPPESFLPLAATIDRTFHTAGVQPRLWDTGTTYRIPEDHPLDQARAIAYATRFYLIGMYLRYDRMYFYNWGGTKIPLVLQADGGHPTAAAHAMATLQHWLAGARITSCGHGTQDGLPARVWQCRYLLRASAGQTSPHAVIRWTETGTTTMPIDRGARIVQTLDGASTPVAHTLRITEQPVLITFSGGQH
ncbi:helix-turn-helix domain-containing protein [Streptomyces sp. NPDC001401]|uniref:helix-turn-helix domain-containing protein n=1 Tax=Streptomyces sp. NPDC001401 TaxID=3364570 RepID=UPI00369B653C